MKTLATTAVLLLLSCTADHAASSQADPPEPPPAPPAVARPVVRSEPVPEDDLKRQIGATLAELARWCADRGLTEAGRDLVDEAYFVDPQNRMARTLARPLAEDASHTAADEQALRERRVEVGRVVAPLYLELFAQQHRPAQNALYDIYLLRALRHDPVLAGPVFERTWRAAMQKKDWSRARMLVDRGGAFVPVAGRESLIAQCDAAELAEITPKLVPGGTFVLKFPELGPTVKKDRRLMQMHVVLPEDYSPSRQWPLYISLGGGGGSDRPNKLTQGMGFVAVGLPYPRNPRTPHRMGIHPQTLWAHYKPMLAKLERVLPNLHPTDRVVFGFSNGANAISALVAFSAGEFTKQYRHLIIQEGGMHQRSWSDEAWQDLRSGALLYSGGDQSFARQITGMHAEAVEHGVDAELLVYAGGHKPTDESRRAAREWIRRHVGN